MHEAWQQFIFGKNNVFISLPIILIVRQQFSSVLVIPSIETHFFQKMHEAWQQFSLCGNNSHNSHHTMKVKDHDHDHCVVIYRYIPFPSHNSLSVLFHFITCLLVFPFGDYLSAEDFRKGDYIPSVFPLSSMRCLWVFLCHGRAIDFRVWVIDSDFFPICVIDWDFFPTG